MCEPMNPAPPTTKIFCIKTLTQKDNLYKTAHQ
jgi:hypothetical protein